MQPVIRLKYIGLVALATLALLSVAGTASATILTSPAGTTYTGSVKAESQGNHLAIDAAGATVNCGKSNLEWNVESHGAALTAKGDVTGFTAEQCGTTTVTVLDPGEFELHTRSPSTEFDWVTWLDFELTIVTHSVFGPIDCTYGFNFLTLGAITSSKTTGQTARFKVESTLFPLLSGNAFCSKSMRLTGDYRITSPDYLDVD